MGSGPFRFVSWERNQQLVLEANDSFPEGLGGRPYLDRAVFRVIPEMTTLLYSTRFEANIPAAMALDPEGKVYFTATATQWFDTYEETDWPRIATLYGVLAAGLRIARELGNQGPEGLVALADLGVELERRLLAPALDPLRAVQPPTGVLALAAVAAGATPGNPVRFEDRRWEVLPEEVSEFMIFTSRMEGGQAATSVDFESSLRSALADGELAGLEIERTATDTPVGANGNNVDLRKETLAAIQSQFQYQVLTRAINDHHNLIKIAAGAM